MHSAIHEAADGLARSAASSLLQSPSTSNQGAYGATVLRTAGVAELQSQTLGRPDVCIAVLDGAVDLSHPCFEGANLRTLPSLARGGGPSSHGTHVASLLFGQPGSNAPGIAPGCAGILIPIFAETRDGALEPCSQLDLARAIAQAVENGASVINISGGQLTAGGEAIDFLRQAVEQAAASNVLIVAAVGNDGCECLHVPAALDPVLAVGAIGDDGSAVSSSNWAAPLSAHGVMAPGWRIPGAAPGGGVAVLSGTSFSTPIVSGVAALLLSLQREIGQEADAMAVRRALLQSAVACDPRQTRDCRAMLAGTLNVPGAHELIARTGNRYRSVHRGVAPSQSEQQEIHGISRKVGWNGEEMSPETNGIASDPAKAGAVAPAADCSCGLRASALKTEPVGQLAPPASGAAAVRAQAVLPSCDDGFSDAMSPFPKGQKAFVLGRLYYDFGTEARRDYFTSQMGGGTLSYKIWDPTAMAEHLKGRVERDGAGEIVRNSSGDAVLIPGTGHEEDANALIWTLYIDQDPVYALVPADQFAALTFQRLVDFLEHQQTSKSPDTFRVAVAGTIRGSIVLLNGTVVPVLSLVTRGLFDWDIDALLEAASEAHGAEDSEAERTVDAALENFLRRIYFELRNLGVSSSERAMNFAATNVFTSRKIFANAFREGLVLDKITVGKSPICRRDSDCWDIGLRFFDPQHVFEKARRVYEYTIDVSDVIPVQVGLERQYDIFSGPQ